MRLRRQDCITLQLSHAIHTLSALEADRRAMKWCKVPLCQAQAPNDAGDSLCSLATGWLHIS